MAPFVPPASQAAFTCTLRGAECSGVAWLPFFITLELKVVVGDGCSSPVISRLTWMILLSVLR